MARSLAILMMLEGHFTGAALDASYRDTSYFLYNAWHLFHGLTAPMFFTVTGLIFVYLLIGNEDNGFFENKRVRKGIHRVGTLFFWGYLIQFSFKSIMLYFKTGRRIEFEEFFGFHVLQSIAMCLLLIILMYGIFKLIKMGPFYLYLIVMAVVMLILSGILRHYHGVDLYLLRNATVSEPNYWPNNFPIIIQNMFYGPKTVFSFVHTSSYALAGGALGAIIRTNQDKVKNYRFILKCILGGIGLALLSFPLLDGIEWFIERLGIIDDGYFHQNVEMVARLGQVIAVIGLLILIERLFDPKAGLFMKIGQHTLPIYVVHVIVLYGGITGYGLKPDLFNRNLEPYWAILISITALLLSALMVKYIEPLERIYDRIFRFWKVSKNK